MNILAETYVLAFQKAAAAKALIRRFAPKVKPTRLLRSKRLSTRLREMMDR